MDGHSSRIKNEDGHLPCPCELVLTRPIMNGEWAFTQEGVLTRDNM